MTTDSTKNIDAIDVRTVELQSKFKIDNGEVSNVSAKVSFVTEDFSRKWDKTLTGEVWITTGGKSYHVTVVRVDEASDRSLPSQLHCFVDGRHYTFNLPVTSFNSGGASHDKGAVSPMPGKLIKVNVKSGDSVKKGAALIVMEAMKMEHVIRAAADGVVDKVLYKEGEIVQAGGKVLVTFKA